jgi:hypothetical protein
MRRHGALRWAWGGDVQPYPRLLCSLHYQGVIRDPAGAIQIDLEAEGLTILRASTLISGRARSVLVPVPVEVVEECRDADRLVAMCGPQLMRACRRLFTSSDDEIAEAWS